MRTQRGNSQIDLQELAGGAFAEKLNEALIQVAENIQNPNTDASAKRGITINIKFQPNKTRQIANTTISVVTKLAATEAIDTQMVMGINMRTGELEIAEYDGIFPGQMSLEEYGEDLDKGRPKADYAGKPIDLRNRKRQPAEGLTASAPDFDPDTGEIYGQAEVRMEKARPGNSTVTIYKPAAL